MRVKVGEPVWVRSTKKGSPEPFVPATITNVQQGGARLTVKRPDGTEGAYDTRNADLAQDQFILRRYDAAHNKRDMADTLIPHLCSNVSNKIDMAA